MMSTQVSPKTEHTAFWRSKALVKHFTERDRLEHIPEMPSDLEAEVLDNLITMYSFSLSGSSDSKKLAALRCMWWGWCKGNHWAHVHHIEPAGKAAWGRWLAAREADGDEKSTRLRKRWFPTEEEKAADRIRKQAKERSHDALHALRVQGIDFAQETTTINHQLKELALQIGRGANNIDDLIAEIRTLTRRIDEIEEEGHKLDAERARITGEAAE
jgi:hypothetical protein